MECVLRDPGGSRDCGCPLVCLLALLLLLPQKVRAMTCSCLHFSNNTAYSTCVRLYMLGQTYITLKLRFTWISSTLLKQVVVWTAIQSSSYMLAYHSPPTPGDVDPAPSVGSAMPSWTTRVIQNPCKCSPKITSRRV